MLGAAGAVEFITCVKELEEKVISIRPSDFWKQKKRWI